MPQPPVPRRRQRPFRPAEPTPGLAVLNVVRPRARALRALHVDPQAKASHQRDEHRRRYHSFRGLFAHLATLTRNDVRFARNTATVAMLTEPTSAQREAFDLIGAPIPLTLK